MKLMGGKTSKRLNDVEVLLSIIDNLPTSIFVKDDQLRFVLANKACQTVMAQTEDELLGRSDTDFFAQEKASVFIANDRNVIDSGKTLITEEIVKPESGQTIVSQTRKAKHHAPDGKTYLIGTNTDLTELKAREEQYRVLSEAVPVGILQVGEAGEVQFANQLCLSYFGRTNKPQKLAELHDKLANMPAGFPAAKSSFETEFPDGQGNARNVLVKSTGWIDQANGSSIAILSFVDVSEMVALRQNTELQSRVMTQVAVQTRESVGTISGSTAELNDGAAMLAGQTSQQMASLREITAAVRQLSQGVRQNSGDSEKANRLALDARTVADRGNQMLAATVSAMDRIMESSRKVESIVSLINEIAFQTNILALNAAVEAARAGDAGRGFAVVATEVRSLAQRSAQSLKDIRSLMQISSGQVSEGAKLVGSLGQTLTEISKTTQDAASLASRIALASQEQSAGILQVDSSVAQLEKAAAANAELVQSFSRAVAAVDNSMDELASLVDQKAA